ncbi:DUF11 domain-containing protein, partial [Candidatus Dojkabacteria bacterium]|nr:DUF11 domain-containing protein [Candidatus Dojkabacteria bacterium]
SVDNTQAVIQYSITVTNPNNIPMTASVVDQLPGFVQSANVTGISNGGVFNNTNKTITWNPLNLPANGSVTVTYTLTVAAANFGTIDNLAIVYDETGQEDDRDTESNVIDPNIEVLVNKNHSSQTVSGSTVVNYTVRLQNIGTTSLVNLTVRDTLDNAIQTSWVSNISGGGSIAGTVITWTGINLQPGQTLTLTYTVTFPAGMFGTFDNVVVVTDPGGDQLGTDNDSVTIPPLDILIDKSSSIVSLDNSQGVIRYSITVTNPNLLQVTTRVVDQLPAFVQAGDVTNISNGGVFDAASKTITWDPLVIPASGSVTLTYTLTVNSANFGEIYNVAVVYGEDGQEDDRDAESVILDPDINLYVNKSHTRQIVNGATVVTYTIEVTNTGANALLNLTVQDNLPSGVLPSWVSNISGGGTLSSGVITWTGVNLQPQQSIQLSYTVTFPDGIAGTFRNLVIVRGPNGEELGQDSDPISISVVTPTPTVPGVSLPDTAIFGEEADLVIIGVLLLIIGLLVYQLEIRSGFGRFILGKPLNAIFGTRDDYEENAIKQVSRNLKHRKKK